MSALAVSNVSINIIMTIMIMIKFNLEKHTYKILNLSKGNTVLKFHTLLHPYNNNLIKLAMYINST